MSYVLYRALLQKRPIIWRSLRIVSTSYLISRICHELCHTICSRSCHMYYTPLTKALLLWNKSYHTCNKSRHNVWKSCDIYHKPHTPAALRAGAGALEYVIIRHVHGVSWHVCVEADIYDLFVIIRHVIHVINHITLYAGNHVIYIIHHTHLRSCELTLSRFELSARLHGVRRHGTCMQKSCQIYGRTHVTFHL